MRRKGITMKTILKLHKLGLFIVFDPDAGFIRVG